MQIEVDASEARVLLGVLRKIPRAMSRPIWDVLRRSAGQVATTTRALLRQPGPSAPGEPPGRRTGTLARSIRTRRGRFFSYQVFNTPETFYGRFHEFGTGERRTRRGASRGTLAQRPFLTAALARHEDEIEMALAAAITRVIEDAGTVRLR